MHLRIKYSLFLPSSTNKNRLLVPRTRIYQYIELEDKSAKVDTYYFVESKPLLNKVIYLHHVYLLSLCHSSIHPFIHPSHSLYKFDLFVVEQIVNVDLDDTIVIGSNQIKYWARYLNEGSKVSITWKMNVPVDFYIVEVCNTTSIHLSVIIIIPQSFNHNESSLGLYHSRY